MGPRGREAQPSPARSLALVERLRRRLRSKGMRASYNLQMVGGGGGGGGGGGEAGRRHRVYDWHHGAALITLPPLLAGLKPLRLLPPSLPPHPPHKCRCLAPPPTLATSCRCCTSPRCAPPAHWPCATWHRGWACLWTGGWVGGWGGQAGLAVHLPACLLGWSPAARGGASPPFTRPPAPYPACT